MNIYNFTNRQLCEYQLIFPTIASLLDHLLFTIGNGYNVENGMIIDYDGIRIDEYPVMSTEDWNTLIEKCHKKEEEYSARGSNFYNKTPERQEEYRLLLEEAKSKYFPRNVSADMFTEEALLRQLYDMQSKRREKSSFVSYIRPYPLSEKYSDIYHLTKDTPRWFLEIALNLCSAWVTFLEDALNKGDVWIKPSLRKKTSEDIKLDQLADEILSEMGTPPGPRYKEQERDYADESYTKEHLDMLRERVSHLKNLLKE